MRQFLFVSIIASVSAIAFIAGCGEEPGKREFDKGLREIEQGNYVSGKTLLEKSMSKRVSSPENAIAYNFLGIASWRLKQLEQAVDAFEESRRLNPDMIEPTYNLGVIMAESGNYVEATRLLEEASLIDMSDSRAAEFLGHLYTQQGKWAEARRSLFEALDREPDSSRILTAIGLVELHVEGADSAVTYLMRALENDNSYAPAVFDLGVIYLHEVRNSGLAVNFLKKYLDLGEDEERLEYARSALRDLAGMISEPAVLEPAAVVLKPRNPVQKETKATLSPEEQVKKRLEMARTVAEQGRLQRTLRLCLESANEASEMKNDELQRRSLEMAVELCPLESKAHYELAAFRLGHKQYAEALDGFKRVTALAPQWADPFIDMARAAKETGDFDVAVIGYKRGLELEEGHADGHYELAALYDDNLKHEEHALTAYRDFTRLFPGDTRVIKANSRIEALDTKRRERERIARKKAKKKRRLEKEAAALKLAEQKAAEPQPEVEKQPPERESVQVVIDNPSPGRSETPPVQEVASRRIELEKSEVRNTRAAIQAYNRGTIYQERKDWNRAIHYYKRAVENDDTMALAFFNLGTVYNENGDLDLAKDAYLRALDLEPDRIGTRFNLSLIYSELKQDTAAITHLKRIVERKDDYASAHYMLGFLYSKNPQTHELTRSHYKKFLVLAPTEPASSDARHWLRTH